MSLSSISRQLGRGLVLALLVTSAASGETVTLLKSGNVLQLIDSEVPGTSLRDIQVVGLAAGEALTAIDYRPATGALYGLAGTAGTARLYRIALADGFAAPVGAAFSEPAFEAIGFDFDPVRDEIRVVTNTSRNYVLDPEGGSLTLQTPLAFVAGDVHAAEQASLNALAYSDNLPGGAIATAFGIGFFGSQVTLVRVGSLGGSPQAAAGGAVTTIGTIAVSGFSTRRTGLDVSASGVAYALVHNSNDLRTINLANGADNTLGSLPGGAMATDLAVRGPAFGASVLENPELDGDIAHWDVENGLSFAFDPQDNDGLEGSGSLVATDVTAGNAVVFGGQCVVAEPGGWDFGAQMLLPSGQGDGSAGIIAQAFTSTDCSGAVADFASRSTVLTPDVAQYLSDQLIAPAGTRSILVGPRLVEAGLGFHVRYDNLFLQPAGGCVPDDFTLCLRDQRFSLTTNWTRTNGQQGQGHAVKLTRDTGYFWFFSPANVEVVVKVLDGCALNQHHWVFAAGLTNVGVELGATDGAAQVSLVHATAPGVRFPPTLDSQAFATCP